MRNPVALTIAGSDPTGGAGIQADLKTFAAHRVCGASVVSVVTAQNARRFELFPLPFAAIKAQMEAVFEGFDVRAIKIGMLGTVEIVQAVIDRLQHHNRDRHIPVVLDPVLKASNGGIGLEAQGLALLRDELLPLCTLVKPNLYEAAVLLDEPEAVDPVQMAAQAQKLGQHHDLSILLSGGHLPGPELMDILFHEDQIYKFSSGKRQAGEFHGTGCMLTSAIAANLAYGHDLVVSVERARDALSRLLSVHTLRDQYDRENYLDPLALLLPERDSS